jgi:hydrogenase assembly chaperone HypC/HupF
VCVTYPMQVVAVDDDRTVDVSSAGRIQRISTIVLGDRQPHPGDWLLVLSGLAVAVIDEAEAAERRRLLDQAREA